MRAVTMSIAFPFTRPGQIIKFWQIINLHMLLALHQLSAVQSAMF